MPQPFWDYILHVQRGTTSGFEPKFFFGSSLSPFSVMSRETSLREEIEQMMWAVRVAHFRALDARVGTSAMVRGLAACGQLGIPVAIGARTGPCIWQETSCASYTSHETLEIGLDVPAR